MQILVNPKLNNDELEDIVEIHMTTFKGFFLTFLGSGFLKQMYKGFIEHPNSGLIVAKDKKIIGVLAYSENLSEFYKYLLKKKSIIFAWYSLGAFLRRPTSLFRLFRAFLKPKESKREENYIELSSIGVAIEYKGKHVGSKLIDKLKNLFDEKNFEYINLETDAENNEYANKFYQKNNFKLVRTYETPEGRKMNEYRWCK